MISNIKRTVETLWKNGIIRPVDPNTENVKIVSNVFVVINEDGSTRMVCEYVFLNKWTSTDPYPTPSVPDMLTKFEGKTIFSTFDIIKAFYNVPVEESTQTTLAFTTKYGVFTWCYMPFGPTNAPSVWARASDYAFRQCLDLIKYIDDLVIARKATEELTENENHLKSLKSFFQCLTQYNLKIKLSKCSFFQKRIKFLGQIITPEGREVDDKYVKKLLSFRKPSTYGELRSYLGAVEWLSHHIYGCKKYVEPLRPLLKGLKNKSQKNKTFKNWTETHDEAFKSLQFMIKNHTKVLHHPDFKQEFYVFTDASDRY